MLEHAGRTHLSLIAVITLNGLFYVAGQRRSFTGEDIVWFLNRLCGRYRKRDLLIIWDDAAIHRSQAVKAFLRHQPGRVHLEPLPPYSPKAIPNRIDLESARGQTKKTSIPVITRLNVSRSEATHHFRERSETGSGLLL